MDNEYAWIGKLIPWMLNTMLKAMLIMLVTVPAYLGICWIGGWLMPLPGLRDALDIKGVLLNVLQQLPFMGKLIDSAAAMTGLAMGMVPFTTRSFLEQAVFGMLLAMIYDLFAGVYKRIRLFVDGMLGYDGLPRALSNAYGCFLMVLMSAIITMQLNQFLVYFCDDAVRMAVAATVLACIMLGRQAISASRNGRHLLGALLKLLYELLNIALIYMVIGCVYNFSNMELMNQTQILANVILAILGIMGLTLIGAFSLAGIYPKN